MKVNKRVLAAAGFCAAALVGGTFAYYNQTLSVDNPLSTGKYENELVEEFTPRMEEVLPGATIDKKVGVANTGDYPVLVRIRMDERWQREGEDRPFGHHSSAEHESFNVMRHEQDMTDPQKTLWIATQSNADKGDSDGLTEGDCSVVRKTFSDSVIETLPADEDAEGWSGLVTDPRWFYAEDGWWYYTDILDAGEESGTLLEAIGIASNIDLGEYVRDDFYSVKEKGLSAEERNEITDWKKYVIKDSYIEVYEKSSDGTYPATPSNTIKDRDEAIDRDSIADLFDLEASVAAGPGDALYRRNESYLNPDAMGYADASYTLKIYSQFVQATPDAIMEGFGNGEEGAKTLAEDVRKLIDNLMKGQ